MTAGDFAPWIAMGALFMTFIAYAINATSYVSRIELAGQRAVDAAKDQLQKSIEQTKELMAAIIERELEKERKARHDMSSHIQSQVGSLDNDYRRIIDRMTEMVHKEDLTAVESRLVLAINKIDGQLVSALDKLTQQIESIRLR